MAPACTPAPIISSTYQQAAKIALDPEMKAKLAQLGLDATSDSPDVLAAIIKADIAKWAKVIKSANIKAGEERLSPARQETRMGEGHWNFPDVGFFHGSSQILCPCWCCNRCLPESRLRANQGQSLSARHADAGHAAQRQQPAGRNSPGRAGR